MSELCGKVQEVDGGGDWLRLANSRVRIYRGARVVSAVQRKGIRSCQIVTPRSNHDRS